MGSVCFAMKARVFYLTRDEMAVKDDILFTTVSDGIVYWEAEQSCYKLYYSTQLKNYA